MQIPVATGPQHMRAPHPRSRRQSPAAQEVAQIRRSLRPDAACSRAAIPWRAVGAGWFLALWDPASGRHRQNRSGLAEPGPQRTELYLVDPDGKRFAVMSFPQARVHRLASWSGDGERALLSAATKAGKSITEVDLTQGRRLRRLAVVGGADVSYTRPSGSAILVDDGTSVTWVGSEASAGTLSSTSRVIGSSVPSTNETDGTDLVDGSADSMITLVSDLLSRQGTRGRGRVVGALPFPEEDA